ATIPVRVSIRRCSVRKFATFLLLTFSLSAAEKGAVKRLDEAAAVFSEIMAGPDKGIPHELLETARCAVIVPGLKKGAFIVGAQFGKGFVTCRQANGAWSAPG